MRRTRPTWPVTLATLLLLLSASLLAPAPAAAQTIEGRWYGILRVDGQPLRLVLTFEADSAGAWRGLLRSVDQGGALVPLPSVSVQEARLAFEAPAVGGRYAGAIDSAWTTIRGSWTQGDATFPLTLTRAIPQRDSTAAARAAAPPADDALADDAPADDAPADDALADDALARIDALVHAELRRSRVPGLSLALVRRHALQLERGYGLADVEQEVAATAATSYRLASLAKPITAVAALQLVERGALELDAPVQRYVPDFPAKRWPVTARQLLTHTSGIRHYRAGELTSTRRYPSVAASLAQFADDPLLFEPGSTFLYSTFGYVLLGAVIEGGAGEGYAAYVRRELFEPAGMRTARPDDVAELVPHRASGYRLAADGLRNAPLADVSNRLPAGGLRATAGDVARFAVALLTDVLLPRGAREAMWTVHRPADGSQATAGYGWRVTTHDGRREAWHDGTQPQVSSLLYLRPDAGSAVVLLANLEGVDLLGLARAVADELEPPPAPAAPTAAAPAAPASPSPRAP